MSGGGWDRRCVDTADLYRLHRSAWRGCDGSVSEAVRRKTAMRALCSTNTAAATTPERLSQGRRPKPAQPLQPRPESRVGIRNHEVGRSLDPDPQDTGRSEWMFQQALGSARTVRNSNHANQRTTEDNRSGVAGSPATGSCQIRRDLREGWAAGHCTYGRHGPVRRLRSQQCRGHGPARESRHIGRPTAQVHHRDGLGAGGDLLARPGGHLAGGEHAGGNTDLLGIERLPKSEIHR